MACRPLLAALCALPALPAAAGPSLFGQDAVLRASSAPVQVAYLDQAAVPTGQRGSLFAGRAATSLFAPVAKRERVAPPEPEAPVEPGAGGVAGAIRDLVAAAEAGPAGYDAVVWAAKIKPPKRPTEMTLGEIYAWIKATPRQHHAIGRYQFIPATLRRLVREAGLPDDTRFAPEVQDRLADMLLAEAGLHEFTAGRLERKAFMHGLSKIWAGLPTAGGKSFYHGHAGNKATMSWARFDAAMKEVVPG